MGFENFWINYNFEIFPQYHSKAKTHNIILNLVMCFHIKKLWCKKRPVESFLKKDMLCSNFFHENNFLKKKNLVVTYKGSNILIFHHHLTFSQGAFSMKLKCMKKNTKYLDNVLMDLYGRYGKKVGSRISRIFPVFSREIA